MSSVGSAPGGQPDRTAHLTADRTPLTGRPRVLAVVPARGGSKGLPQKNLRKLRGHSLVGWSVVAATDARSVTRTICSTDDEEIAASAKRYGAEVPFLRPAELARDDTLDLPVFQHMLRWLRDREDWTPDLVVQLRPTSPIRPIGIVDEAVALLWSDSRATSVRAVVPAPANPYKMWRIDENQPGVDPYMRNLLDVPGIAEPYNSPRQSLPSTWWQVGTIDVVRSSVIEKNSMTGDHVLPLKIDSDFAVDIDSAADLKRAESALSTVRCVRPDPAALWSTIRLLAVDVDGTLTPGSVFYGPSGEELKQFHMHDGQGIALVRAAGVEVALITRESTPFTAARGQKLGLSEIHIGVEDKLRVLRDICHHRGLTSLAHVAYVGDDLSDVAVMTAINDEGGVTCAVANARPEVQSLAQFICERRGGDGAVRDVCDMIVGSHRG
jgi:YrbI family 3-deoxy-D-manno-octulosonate 8-phosphate phosphatase